jgi:hypothetical protein
MYFDVIGSSKDNINTRKDLAALCNRHSLDARRNAKGNLTRPQALCNYPSLEAKRN